MITPVIIAGGSGTRLWPLSRQLYPKQLLSLVGQNTLLQDTVLRLTGLADLSNPMIICNEDHRFLVAEQLRKISLVSPDIILEPVGRNTAPAIAAVAFKALKDDLESVLLVLPADHVMENIPAFHKAVENGYRAAQENHIVTFGIVPDAPETGYGYIQKGQALDDADQLFKVDRFVEKPDQKTAKEYLTSGQYCWNSGMFMFKASVILKEIQKFDLDMYKACSTAMEKSVKDLDFIRLDNVAFSHSPADSIDYAVMEKTDHAVVVPIEAGWNDLGSWEALWQTGHKDENHNVIKGDVILSDVKNSYLHAENRLVGAVGLEDHIIVETKDAVLVSPRDRVQDVKKLVDQLKGSGRCESVNHSKVYRPWGNYETVDISERFQVKRITVKPGAKLSLQKHFHRAEHWTVVAGTAVITKDDQEILLKEDQSVYIPLGTIHRMENPGTIPLELIEVQSGSYLGEDDIVRFEDVYGRSEPGQFDLKN